jgi:hypothetical protein
MHLSDVCTATSASAAIRPMIATQKRKNQQDMTGKINGSNNILITLHVHYGDRIAANTIN